MKPKTSAKSRKDSTGKNTHPAGLAWPAGEVEIIDLKLLTLNEHNPRDHTLDQIEQISRSMDQFGWTIPMLIDEENVLLAGHGRLRAARLKGWTQGPAVRARGWSPEQKRAYLIADNQIASNSSWDRKRLQAELRNLGSSTFDMSVLAFSADDLAKLMVDPAQHKGTGAPEEFTSVVCPTCGHAKRKVEQ